MVHNYFSGIDQVAAFAMTFSIYSTISSAMETLDQTLNAAVANRAGLTIKTTLCVAIAVDGPKMHCLPYFVVIERGPSA